MTNAIAKWPDDLQTRTEEEWRAIGTEENWSNPENRKMILDALTALKVPAMSFARLKAPGRAELIIKEQERLKPGSTKGGAKAAPVAAAPAAAVAKKGAAPKAAGTGTTAASSAPATVDLGPVLAKLEAQGAEIAALSARAVTIETVLKLLLLNPANSDSLALAADQATLDSIAGNTLAELASGNG